jgi:hypothetical protein
MKNHAWLFMTILACGGGSSTSDGGTNDAATPSDGAPNDVVTSNDAGSDVAAPSGPTIGGCPLFPATYPYNVDISGVALDPGSKTYITNLAARAGAIVAEYPGDEWANVVPESQSDVAVTFVSNADDSYGFDTTDTFFHTSGNAQAPIPSNVLYENSSNPNSDHHMMIVEQTTCTLYEMYAWNPSSATDGWEALVRWNLNDDDELPDGWGSTTAAGTPLLPGVIRADEIMAGEIKHAVDIVIPGAAIMQYGYVRPAARAGGACGSNYPADGFPYGGRVRLKSDYDASKFTGTQALVVIAALKKYGMINTDASGETRSSFRLGDGSALDQQDLNQLSMLTWNDFEVPQMTVITSHACN